MVVLLVSGVYIGASLTGQGNSGTTAPATPPMEPFYLTLVITSGNWFNSTVSSQPSYYVLQGENLTSSAVISLPADREIVLTIVNLDNGTDVLSQPFYDQVVGTANDSVSVQPVAGLTMPKLLNPAQLADSGQISNSSLFNPNNISHTFTLIDGITYVNVPVVPNAVESAAFSLPAGSYIWQCECSCGGTSEGWGAAMQSEGWMTGTVQVI